MNAAVVFKKQRHEAVVFKNQLLSNFHKNNGHLRATQKTMQKATEFATVAN